MNKKSTKRKPLTQEQIDKRTKTVFKRKIRNIFTGMGFTYVPTNDHEMVIGLRKVEIDALFIFENIWLLCEDTIKSANIKEHIRTKNEAFGEIKKNLSSFQDKLIELFPDKAELLNRYDVGRIKVYGLYVSKEEVSLSEDEDKLFSNLIFIQPKTLNYFQWISQCIKLSARNEIFRFLNIKNSDIGNISSSNADTKITAPIIYPKSFTGLKNGVRIVSFMMSAEDLLNTCYVLRKDNWSESIWLYQRLIEKGKIKNIRNFLASKGAAFYNNIIVASIVKFALRYLVTVTPAEGKQSLFNYWDGDKNALLAMDGNAIEEYVKFCVSTLRNYFGAIKKNLRKQWDDTDSKLLSVISINGFIIALTRQLSVNGVNDFDFYDRIFNGWTIDFSKDGFKYTSSQYRKFSTQILREVFQISDEIIATI